jgi:hypothetical protein
VRRFLNRPTAILIRPGSRHRAVGRLKVVNMSIPAFAPADEWFY